MTSVGWEVRSATDNLEPASVGFPSPQTGLPTILGANESARPMMTEDELVTALPDLARSAPRGRSDHAVRRRRRGPAARSPARECLRDRPVGDASTELDWCPGPLDELAAHERKITSQNGEDGVIEAIFDAIGTTNQHFVEFGCGNGLECNGAHLLAKGWTGLLMDPFHDSQNPLADVRDEFVTAENIQSLLEKYQVPKQFDLISIDIDGNDFWVWRQITSRPRVVVIEYNAARLAATRVTIRYDPMFSWASTDYVGASLRALEQLARTKKYTLVHCEQHGVNAFFVANECLPHAFEPQPIEAVYRKPNYLGLGFAFPHDPTRTMIDPFASCAGSVT